MRTAEKVHETFPMLKPANAAMPLRLSERCQRVPNQCNGETAFTRVAIAHI
jgi:hypothetical protein